MRKILVGLFMVFCVLHHQAQTPEPPCWYTPDWDWTNLDIENWKGYWQGQDPLDGHYIDVPWNTNASNGNVFNIADLKDYKPEQGWVLLWKDFGCPNVDVPGGIPHFFLYNKFTAVVRCFFYIPSVISLVDQAKLEITWFDEENNTSLLTNTNEFAKPNSEYPLSVNGETAYVIIEDNTGQGWIAGEFMVMFDHAQQADESAYNLRFSLQNLSNSELNANATFSFVTESYGIKDPNTQSIPGEQPGTSEEPQENKPAIANVDWETIESLGEQIMESIPEESSPGSPPQPTTQTSILLNDFFTFISITEDNPVTETNEANNARFSFDGIQEIGDVVPYVKIAFTLFNLFAGKPSEDEDQAPTFRPTISSGSLKLNGTIVTPDDAVNRFIDVPGMDHNVEDTEDFIGVPVYDCPLGNLALEELPMLDKTTYRAPCGWWPDFYACSDPPAGHPSCWNEVPIYMDMDSYRINDNVVMALNKASGLSVEYLWASFSTEDQGNGGATTGGPWGGVLDLVGWNYGLTTGLIASVYGENPGEWYDDIQNMVHSFYNPARAYLVNGTYIFNRATPGQPLRYGTPMIPLDVFRQTAFNVPRGNRVFLKIGAVLSPDDDFYEQSAVLWENTYEIFPGNVNFIGDPGNFGNNTPFNFTWEQMGYRTADIVTSELDGQYETLIESVPAVYIREGDFTAFNIIGDRTLVESNLQPVNFVAESRIRFVTGFKAQAAPSIFKAYINRTSGYIDGENAQVVNEYNHNCEPYPFRSATFEQTSPQSEAGIVSLTFQEETLLIQNEEEMETVDIRIYDASGKMVFEKYKQSLSQVAQMEIGRLPSGVYIYTQQNQHGISQKRFAILR
jgi:hypothetical protein